VWFEYKKKNEPIIGEKDTFGYLLFLFAIYFAKLERDSIVWSSWKKSVTMGGNVVYYIF
jgi:hypothetical protein